MIISVNVDADYYEVPMLEAHWEVASDKDVCYLKQNIPHYGRAEFIQRSGAPLQFSIQEFRIKPYIIKADLAALPAPWMHDETDRHIHPVFLDRPAHARDFNRLSVYGSAAEAMIDALLQGHSPTFTYVRAVTNLDMHEIRVAVSPIKFQEVYEEFVGCRTQLIPDRSQEGF
ncbi:MAG: hypothetical protein ACU85E_09770 [Gammaproteobacteria bacterium]